MVREMLLTSFDYNVQGGVTPIDSIVTAATAVGQWSTVKAAQTGAVNGQSSSKVQSKTRAALFMAMCRQVLQGQIADQSKVNGRKSAWSTVKTPKTAVKALTRGRSCDYSVYGSDTPLMFMCSVFVLLRTFHLAVSVYLCVHLFMCSQEVFISG